MKINKKIICFLTGGHRYKDKDRIVTEIKEKREFMFEDYCCKCGKRTVHIVDADSILRELQKDGW